MDPKTIKWTPAELVMWHILLVALGAGLMGGTPALLEYLASTNVDVVLCLKLALAGAGAAVLGSLATYFRKNGNATQMLLQAAIDGLGQLYQLTGQVHEVVTTQVVATPQPAAAPPQPIVLTKPVDTTTSYVPPPIAVPPSQQPLYMPNLNVTATAAPPAFVPSFVPDLTGAPWDTATSTSPWIPPSPDVHFGDSQIMPAIPKQ